MSARKNEAKTDINLHFFLTHQKKYSNEWETKKTSNTKIQKILDTSSKSGSGNRGEPDLIYVNERKKILILIENKFSISDHSSNGKTNAVKYAEDGVLHYLSFFIETEESKWSKSLSNYLKGWSFVGIAFSGDVNDQYNHLISNFIINDNEVIKLDNPDLLDEDDYLAIFENIDLEEISKNISKSSIEINNTLRMIDSQKRPVLLSALMICLFEKEGVVNDFRNSYQSWGIKTIVRNIPSTIEDILVSEGIDKEKIEVLNNELSFIKTDHDLNHSEILKDILDELTDSVIPLFNKKSNYDIIGKFYEEFLRYAGVANVKKGIVLTPNHITKLFTELVPFKTNDVIFDSCCGTGAFLIAGMNRLIEEIETSNVRNKKEKISNIKESQLVGFEKSSTMYSLAISNMLFRGDGKSRIYNIDTFSDVAKETLAKLLADGVQPTIGFINPPYGGKDTDKNPTKKEIQFLENLLDSVSRFAVMIAPLSTYFKDEVTRNRILSSHTLRAVVNMPGDLFQPNASTHTAIAIFETNIPHNDKKVAFYNLKDDGFILSKSRGRTDVLNKWNSIKKHMLLELNDVNKYSNNIDCLEAIISEGDEWIIQAHSQTDYEGFTDKQFVNSIKSNVIFYLKLKLKLLNQDIDEISMLELLDGAISKKSQNTKKIALTDLKTWKVFNFKDVFSYRRGKRLIKLDQKSGNTAYISSTKINNGIDNYISHPAYMKKHTNAFTINNSGSVGYVFYHSYSFVCSDHCTAFDIKDENIKLNSYIAAFVKPVIEALQVKYNFAREISDSRLAKETILLPATESGDPDWKFMESYIKSLPYSSNL